MATYVVVLGAESDARFRDVPIPFQATGIPTPFGPVDLIFRTRYADEGFSAGVPRETWIDARGTTEQTPALAEVVGAYTNAAAGLLPMIALATNAWVGDVQPKLAYDATPGKAEREFFESFVREERGTLPPIRRMVDAVATTSLLQAIAQHEARNRLTRAGVQYALALGHWRPGNEIMAVAHLFIGMEALTPIALKRELDTRNCSRDELAELWGIHEEVPALRATKLAAEVRRRILFRGDGDTASKARKASDGLEHSFMDFAGVRELAENVVKDTARYLREAILEFSGVDQATRDTLTSPPFDIPLRSHYARYVWGTLVGAGDELAAQNQEYPVLHWGAGLKSFEVEEGTDRHLIGLNQTMTFRAAPGIQFRMSRFEMWAAGGSSALPAEQPGEWKVVRSDDTETRRPMLDPDVRALVRDLAEIVNTVGGEAVEVPPYLHDVAALFDRCRGMFNAVLVLLDKGFAHEATILCSPLFVDSLALAEIADADDSRRVGLIVGRRLAALADVDALFRETQAHGDDEVSDALARLADARRSAEELARRHGADATPWQPDDQVERLADSQGRGDEYSAYLTASLFSRGSAAATDERFSVGDDKVIEIGGEAINVESWSTPTALFAAQSVAHACRAPCQVLGYSEPAGLADAIARIEELAADADGSTNDDSGDHPA
jgi:hypothetical protein